MDKILRNKKAIFIFIAPALIMFVLVLVIPMVQMVYYSLCDYAALTPPKFTGLANYKNLFFKDSTFKIALKNSIFFMIFSAITQQVIGLGLAVMLTNIKKGRNLFKNIYYLPSVLSSAALGLLWAFMFNPKIGINNLLAQFGIKGPLWLMDSKGFNVLPMWVIAFVALWKYVGQKMMLYMVTSLSLNCIGSLKFYDLVYNMTNGGPNHRTEVLATELYAVGFNYFKYGYASAISVVLLVMCLIVTLLFKKVIKVETYEC